MCHLKFMSFFELDETESNEPSVKIQNISKFLSKICGMEKDSLKVKRMGRMGIVNV